MLRFRRLPVGAVGSGVGRGPLVPGDLREGT